jgi:hypothetical protein
MAKVDIQSVAVRAIELHSLIAEAQEELERLKETLRKSASKTPWSEYPTRIGSARAAFVDPFMGPRAGKEGLVSLLPALDLLGVEPETFDRLFKRTVVVSIAQKNPQAFQASLRLASSGARLLVKSLVEKKPAQVRITLTKVSK